MLAAASQLQRRGGGALAAAFAIACVSDDVVVMLLVVVAVVEVKRAEHGQQSADPNPYIAAVGVVFSSHKGYPSEEED